MVASQRHTPLSPLCLQDPHEAWSPVRDTHHSLLSAYKTHTKHGRQSETHTSLSSLPTRSTRSVVAGQRHTPLSSLPTRPTRSMVASQRHTPLSPLCLQDPHEAWSPVRDTHPSPICLQDPHEAWSPVRDTHPSLLSAYKTRTKHGRRYTHLSSLPTRPARSMVAGHLWTHGNSLSFSKWSTSLSLTSGGWLYPGPPSRSLSPGHALSFPLVVDLRHFSPYLLSLPHSFFSSCSAQSHPHLSRSISLTFLSLSISVPTIRFPSHYSVIVTQ